MPVNRILGVYQTSNSHAGFLYVQKEVHLDIGVMAGQGLRRFEQLKAYGVNVDKSRQILPDKLRRSLFGCIERYALSLQHQLACLEIVPLLSPMRKLVTRSADGASLQADFRSTAPNGAVAWLSG